MKKKKLPIDIGIVTHDRDEQLLRCVCHILANSYLPNKIIIVHSKVPAECQSKPAITTLCERTGVDLEYIHVAQRGISYSRNRVLKEVSSPIFGFIDDDEYPTQNWLDFVWRYLGKHLDIQVLSGPKIPTNLTNYWHKIWYEIYRVGFKSVGSTTFVTSSNSFFRKDFIINRKILFDNAFINSSEDLVFSHHLTTHSAKMLFHKDLLDYHDFRNSSVQFFRQWYGYGESTASFEKKYLKISTQGLLLRVAPRLQGHKLMKKAAFYLWPGLIVMDLAFALGFSKGIINSLKKA